MKEKPVRILIADDHYVVRQGLKLVLSEHFPHVEIGEASDGNEALEAVWAKTWDVLLLDISMPGRGGLEALKDIKQAQPKLPVIILSMHPEDQFAIRVLKLGASAYIRKDSAGQELVKGVTAALNGNRYITPSIAEKLAIHVTQDQDRPPHESLSDREYQVMSLIANGKTVKEVAAELSLSVKTISTYRSRILEKMNLQNNSQIMRYAVQQSLVDVNTAM
ncbi:MAG: response regulator transcription factor [Chthoniobacteraceae bacterium]